jgi:glycosyltransferase involved in cell wall biosynthesis
LVAAVQEAVQPLNVSYEIIITDDASTDRSWEILKELATRDARIRIQRLASQSGQSAALWAGLQAAKGCDIVTMDADLQNDPKDLPKLLEPLARFDCVCGSRVAARSKGDNLLRVISSRIANAVRNQICGEKVSDSACCFRAFKRECIEGLKYFHGMHRFWPALVKIEGFTVTEVPIRQNSRVAGQSHYGIWNRLFSSFYDLLAVRWMKKRMFRYQIAESISHSERE